MNIEQWKIRIQEAKTRTELVRIQDSLSEELKGKAQQLKALKHHGGWKILEEYFDAQEKLLRDQLEIAKISDVVNIQTEIKVLRKFRSFLKNLVSQFEN